MFLMYDSVTLSQVPAGPHAVACYRNGRFANEGEARRRFPHARILTIDVTGGIVADCLDIERGDAHPATAPGWAKRAHSKGVWRPCLYASQSDMPQVEKALQDAGIPRAFYRLWVANFNFAAVVNSPFDAHQFTDHALGRNLDESICRDDFFPPLAPAPETWDAAKVQKDRRTGRWEVTPLPLEHHR